MPSPVSSLRAIAGRLAAGDAPTAGGLGLRAGAVPLVLTGLVWRPDPERREEVAAFARAEGLPPAVAVVVGDAEEAAWHAAGYRPVAGLALDPEAPPDDDGPEGESAAWDRAREVAAVLARDAAPGAEGPPDASLIEALSALLAAAVADDDAMRIELGGDGEAAMLVYEDDATAVVVLSGGRSGRMVAGALATARGLGKDARRLVQVAPDHPEAVLRRWERTS